MHIHDAVVVGAGLGGVAAGVSLRQQGIEDFKIIDRADGPGGTWRSNSYPGCGCDTQMIAYQFSFSLNPDWDSLYPKAPQILEYIEGVVDQFGLAGHMEYGVTLLSATWDEEGRHWLLSTEQGEYRARAVFMALGQFHTPNVPSVPGIGEFSGPAFHSGAWNHEVDLSGKRVAVVGSAASAVQLIPEVAQVASEVKVFQRTPNWVISRGDRVVEAGERAVLRALPDAVTASRDFALANADALIWPVFSYDETAREYFTSLALAHLEAQVPDAELRARLTPDYPIGCKRLLLSDDLYPTLGLDHVELVDQGIVRVTQDGVVTSDGSVHEVDVIVWATGFVSSGWEEFVPVRGARGSQLEQAWRDEPRTLLGVSAPDFPNMFYAYGPNTNLGHGPVTYMLECQAEHFAEVVRAMKDEDVQVFEVSEEAVEQYHEQLHKSLATSTWADDGCASYYKNAAGVVTKNWMGSMAEYRDALRVAGTQVYVRR